MVQWLKKEVVANITEDEAKKLLKELCDILPDTVTAQVSAMQSAFDILNTDISKYPLIQRITFDHINFPFFFS